MHMESTSLVHQHFLSAAEVWAAFAAGKISAAAREAALRPLRLALHEAFYKR